GLILFLVAGLVTARFGDEQGLVVAEGDTLTVQPIGTPGLLLVQNLGFDALGLATGSPTDFTTDLAVYRDGEQLARKTIPVNDPLTVGGYTFHQNGFGPAPDREIRSTVDDSVLWSGPVPLTDAAGGRPLGAIPIPGRPYGLELLLDRTDQGVGTLIALPYAVRGTLPDGTPDVVEGFPVVTVRGETVTMEGLDMTLTLRGFSQYTLLNAKPAPGPPGCASGGPAFRRSTRSSRATWRSCPPRRSGSWRPDRAGWPSSCRRSGPCQSPGGSSPWESPVPMPRRSSGPPPRSGKRAS